MKLNCETISIQFKDLFRPHYIFFRHIVLPVFPHPVVSGER
jgi:hypothetical protein